MGEKVYACCGDLNCPYCFGCGVVSGPEADAFYEALEGVFCDSDTQEKDMNDKYRHKFTKSDACVIVDWSDGPDGYLMRVVARGEEAVLLPMLAEGLFGNDARAYRLIGEPDGVKSQRSADELVSAIP